MLAATSYLVTGASRGLGLEYTRQLLSSPKINFVATARNPASATELQKIKASNEGRLMILEMDVTKDESVKAAVNTLETSGFLPKGLDVLINNAGVNSGGHALLPSKTPLKTFDMDIQTNLYGVVRSTLAFLPLLRQGEKKQVITVSTTVGSFDNFLASTPLYPLYASSKAGVNMWMKKLSNELKEEGFTTFVYSPGYVKTDFTGGLDGPAELFVEDAAAQAIANIFTKVTPEWNGRFFDVDGSEVKCRQLLASSPEIKIVATARNPATATELKKLQDANEGRVYILELDVTSGESVKAAVATLEGSGFLPDGLDVLVNNAGVAVDGFTTLPSQTTIDTFELDIQTNVYGVARSTVGFLPLLRRGQKKQIITVSSTMGSFSEPMAKLTVAPMYCSSKAAVNMWMLKLANELKEAGFAVVSFSPGWVKTDMNGGVDGPAPLFVEEAGTLALENIFKKVTAEWNGRFFTQDGEEVGW
uniref:NAD(P)-binding protein n=1 Tax=Leucosporidium scottii TaxID=5278 RepID=A0A0H5G9S9_9BASI|nr:hypothetical protein ls5930a1_00091 [Leucosporidium scottii]